MKIKHMPGGCYCCGCIELDEDELPIAEIEGYTFIGWGGSPCCKCAFYTKDEIEFTEECSDVFATLEINTEREWQEMAQLEPKPKYLSGSFPFSCPSLDEYCCFGSPFAIANHEYSDTSRLTYKAVLRYAASMIQICFSRQEVTCSGSEPELKWVVLLKYTFSYDQKNSAGRFRSISHVHTNVGGDCFELLPEELDIPCDSCEIDLSPVCTYDEVEVGIPNCGITGGIVTFDRVKFFDDLPSGTEIFDNSDTPEDCTWEFCETEPNYETQTCLEISSYPPCWPSCYCNSEDATYIEEVDVVDFSGQCSCNACIGLGNGINFFYLAGEDCGFVGVVCCGCTADTNPSDGHQDCPGWTENWLRYPCGTGNDGSIDYDQSCAQWLSDSGFVHSVLASLCIESVPQWGGPPGSLCVDGVSTGAITPPNCYGLAGLCNMQNCDANCCEELICPGNNETIACTPKYRITTTNVTAYSWSVSCSLNPVSFCISYPSVTVEFP
jgi:hypothetical protein